MNERVVISGIGVVSPIGIGREAYWDGLFRGRTAFKPVTLFDAACFGGGIAGEISGFDPSAIIGKAGLIDLDRTTTLLLSAAKCAVEDSELIIDSAVSGETGISVGSVFGSLKSLSDFDRDSVITGPRFVNASRFPNTVANGPAGRLAIRLGIRGVNITVSTGMCSSLDAIDAALRAIEHGRARRMLAGGTEELSRQMFLGFLKAGCLSAGAAGCCPFDKRRGGIVPGEGAAVLVLERLDCALRRNAPIYAEVLSSASCFDPYSLRRYNNTGAGMAGSMSLAVKNAGLGVEDVDAVFANANSGRDADAAEAAAINKVFKGRKPRVAVTAVKSMIGESFSAAGAMAAAGAAGCITRGIIPPTVNYLEKDAACDLDCVPDSARECDVRAALVNSFSPHGSNACIALGKYTEAAHAGR